MEDAVATVVAVDQRLPYFSLRLQVSPAFADTKPGQFVMVRIGERLEPFLRRAFSVFDVSKEGESVSICLLGKVIGRGTGLMAHARVGDQFGVLGPLGRGFSPTSSGRSALVAGGVGSAALLMLARSLVENDGVFDFYYGGRGSEDLSFCEEFEPLTTASGGELIYVTEDGSLGERGRVTGPLEQALREQRYDRLYGCGPMPMLAALADLAGRFSVSGQAALETPMGCGYGACLGCAVPHVDGHWALCCKDGPVFDLDEVRW
jgi:dihydroorotate dehydrogenase electron transfer subunit